MGVAALVESEFPAVWGSEMSSAWANTLVGIQLLVFNVGGLEIFHHCDSLTE